MEVRSLRPRVLLADDYPDMVKAVSRLLALDCEIASVNPTTKMVMFTAMTDPSASQAFLEAGQV